MVLIAALGPTFKRVAYEISAPRNDFIGDILRRTGRPYEHSMLLATSVLIGDKFGVVDVGANVGNHTLYWLNCCSGRVVSFEPNPRARKYLYRNLGHHLLTQEASVRECALGRSQGLATLNGVRGNLGATSLGEFGHGPIQVSSLDSFNLDDIDLVKIDVEGMEDQVCEGSIETLRRNRPAVWIEALSDEALTRTTRQMRVAGYLRPPVAIGRNNFLFLSHHWAAALSLRKPLGSAALVYRIWGARYKSARRDSSTSTT